VCLYIYIYIDTHKSFDILMTNNSFSYSLLAKRRSLTCPPFCFFYCVNFWKLLTVFFFSYEILIWIKTKNISSWCVSMRTRKVSDNQILFLKKKQLSDTFRIRQIYVSIWWWKTDMHGIHDFSIIFSLCFFFKKKRRKKWILVLTQITLKS